MRRKGCYQVQAYRYARSFTSRILLRRCVADQLAAYHDKFKEKLGFKDCHVRELGIYALPDPRFKSYIPQIYDCYKNLEREAFVVVMEDLSGLEMMNTMDNVSGWTREH